MKLANYLPATLIVLSLFSTPLKKCEARVGATHIPSKSNYLIRSHNSPVTYTQASPERAPTYTNRASYGVGLSTVNIVPFSNSFIFSNSTSLTGLILFGPLDRIQVFASIPRTDPLNLSLAALYKRVLIENQNIGLHIGGGLGAGNVNTGGGGNFAMGLSAIGGIHFNIPGITQLEAHLDGGATFSFLDSPTGTLKTFQIGALSPALGLSLFYLL